MLEEKNNGFLNKDYFGILLWRLDGQIYVER